VSAEEFFQAIERRLAEHPDKTELYHMREAVIQVGVYLAMLGEFSKHQFRWQEVMLKVERALKDE